MLDLAITPALHKPTTSIKNSRQHLHQFIVTIISHFFYSLYQTVKPPTRSEPGAFIRAYQQEREALVDSY